jgi:hypothetical protein
MLTIREPSPRGPNAIVGYLVDCAIEGTSEKVHKCGSNREWAELEYIH